MAHFYEHFDNETLYPNQDLQQYQGGFSFLINHENGFQLEFQNRKLKNVYLYGHFDKKFKPYKEELPYGIQFTNCSAHIVCKFGEPTSKQGGGPINIGISYDHLGIEITFQTKNWEQPNVAIDQIILYKPTDKTQCGICKKKGEFRCSQCKLVYYCGQNCQKEHWKSHKQFCKQ